ncbi:Alpha-D-glucose-1-phosphate phosphatase YihX [Roseivivax jejudonensis]|uniref:Alpha-D-glucose-1-phosphate phosphatase YihX n=1 Tax=Roseivivax jejudonensis TaxID=1529041 RepID=A0A1X6YGB2_9RHOB|nr:HAD family phosphatase [Roseivivax jejudonensis]SLN20618.1 Alpha-D-glucose-1-phosphate phosphatase YihX [Roseivivax jejudonensis]
MSVDAVIFDIGNVLIEWRPERHFDAVIGAERRRALFSEVDLHEMNDRIDHGHDFRETVEATAARHPGWATEIRMWHDDWLRLAGPEIPHSVRLLRALRDSGVPVFALSNFGIGTFALAEPEYPFLTEFDRRFISGHMGLAKPDAEIYAALEDECGLPPDRLLFVDDRADNIAAAEARGWQTHLFTTPEGWAGRLVADGLLPAERAA